MNDRTLKVSLAGVLIVAAVAAMCAVCVFAAVMFVATLQAGEVSSDLALPWKTEAILSPTAAANIALAPALQPGSAVTATVEVKSARSAGPTPAIQATSVVTHVVQSGENLYRISLAYGVTVSDIMAANGITDARVISVGQQLRIPVNRAVAPPAGTAVPQNGPIISPTASLAQATASASPPTPSATSTPLPRIGVNGLSLEVIVFMPDNVRQMARQIFEHGQEMGRNPRAYSKLGDSTIENPHFMARFDEGPYVLGDYAFLQEAIDYFAGSHGRQGVGVRRGFHSWTVTDPVWADKSLCLPNENSVACEIRLHNPSILLIRLGSNDSGVPAGFEQNMRQVIEYTINNGVIPVLGTKADRFEGSNINNEIIRRLAAEYQVPLWDFDLVAGTIPGRGLDVDGVHLTTFYAHDYTSPTAYQRGHGMHNLTALMTLDVILREVIRESE
jgi:LysM repeat protein